MAGEGHLAAMGTAGSGKTVMAVYRALHLADPETVNSGPTLLVTYNNSLVTYLKHLADDFSGQITVETYHKFARGYLAHRGLMGHGSVIPGPRKKDLLRLALIEVAAKYKPSPFFDRPVDFFIDEFEWIDHNGLRKFDEYASARRIGRKEPLSFSQRRALWATREAYLQQREFKGWKYDWSDLPGAVRDALRADRSERRYRHVVIDEGQDLSPEAIRSLVEAVQTGGSLTFFYDESQQIYGQRTSWRSCNLRVRRVESFTDNYRNTPEIARLALTMAKMEHFRDSADIVMPRTPRSAAGAKPTLYHAPDRKTEIDVMRQQALAMGRSSQVAILARTRQEAFEVGGAIPGVRVLDRDMRSWPDGPGVFVGTYHSAKGLEFDVVFLPFCDSSRMPDADVVVSLGHEEAMARESRLLYVGVTRAKTELLVSYTENLTPILPEAESDLWA